MASVCLGQCVLVMVSVLGMLGVLVMVSVFGIVSVCCSSDGMLAWSVCAWDSECLLEIVSVSLG